jgi:hypothetical protein
MKRYRILALFVGIILLGVFAKLHATKPNLPLFISTGVYSGFCNNQITIGVAQNAIVPLYGLGSNIDPSCQYNFPVQALPVATSGYLGNLAVVSERSEEVSETIPITITLYVDGNPTAVACTVGPSVLDCADTDDKVAVSPSDTFAVIGTCPTKGTTICARGLQVTLDRLLRLP